MIALIEVEESVLPELGVPFILYGVYKTGASKKLKAQYLKLGDLRKQMSICHQEMEKLQEYESD